MKKELTHLSGFQIMHKMANYYFDSLFDNYKAGKDLKIYSFEKPIVAETSTAILEFADGIINKITKVRARYDSYSVIMSTILTGVVYAYVAVKALFGSFGIGNIVQYVGALSQLSSGVSTVMSNIAMTMVNAEALKLYYEFIDIPDVKTHGTLTTEKRADNEYEFEFHNVSFKYPGSDFYALKNLSLKFNIGQRMAVVGMNGSGKTTMIKLLCRLYDPTEGLITLNGIDVKKYDYQEYLDIFSVVFQDFRLFSFPLGQNVASSVDYDRELAEKCLDMVGFGERMKDMPKGLDTTLYKDFEEDGVEISGGEAQKIALARALYKNAPFIVLDEPTAALDPISEFEIYSKFNDIVGARTAVYISHRLSSCRFCDDIAVFHEGELIERGNHDTLVSDESSKYYELWNAQAQHYTGRD
jgi:ATP-binding cassette subfamily B protein